MAARPKSKVVSSKAGLGTSTGKVTGKPKTGLGTSAAAPAPSPSTPPAQAALAAAKAAAGAQIVPFWTPQDMMDSASTEGGIQQQLADLDRQLNDMKVNTDYGLKQNETNATKGKSAVADDAAGRGIFQSSIKDAGMFDVEATRAMQQKFLNDSLATAQLDYETRRRGLNDQLVNFQKAMAAKAAQNASDLSATQSVPDPQAPASSAGGTNPDQLARSRAHVAKTGSLGGFGSQVQAPAKLTGQVTGQPKAGLGNGTGGVQAPKKRGIGRSSLGAWGI